MSVEQIIQDLDRRIAFHHRWRNIWSTSYFTGASLSVVSAALATASAGFITETGEGKLLTAGLALSATVFASLEKLLKTREKWDLHRNSQQAFEIVRLRLQADSDETRSVVDQIEKVVQSYSLQLGDLNQAPADQQSGE